MPLLQWFFFFNFYYRWLLKEKKTDCLHCASRIKLSESCTYMLSTVVCFFFLGRIRWDLSSIFIWNFFGIWASGMLLMTHCEQCGTNGNSAGWMSCLFCCGLWFLVGFFFFPFFFHSSLFSGIPTSHRYLSGTGLKRPFLFALWWEWQLFHCFPYKVIYL